MIATDIIIDLFFLVDFFAMFYTTYQNRQGKEIYDQEMIVLYYIKSPRFVADFLSFLGVFSPIYQ